MIFFDASGRLGNLIFQYAFLEQIRSGHEPVIVTGAKGIENLIEINRKTFLLPTFKYQQYVIKLMKLVFDVLGYFRLISIVRQDKQDYRHRYTIDLPSYNKSFGIFPFVYVKTSYFQSEQFLIKKNKVPKIKRSIENEFLLKKIDINEAYHKVAIHIRRGDYVYETYLGNTDCSLPLSYYYKSIQELCKKISNPFFIFVTDDPNYVSVNFQNVEPKLVCSNDTITDFLTISYANSVILSNSSFSWWASKLGCNKSFIVAPMYWLGFKERVEFPKGVVPRGAIVVDPNIS